jgi:hypothetical protein
LNENKGGGTCWYSFVPLNLLGKQGAPPSCLPCLGSSVLVHMKPWLDNTNLVYTMHIRTSLGFHWAVHQLTTGNISIGNIQATTFGSFLLNISDTTYTYFISSLYVCMAIKHIIVCLWKHHVNLLLQSFRSVSPDLHQC